MKKTILLAYQAIIIVLMLILAGYFMSLGKTGFAIIYVLIALAGVFAVRGELGHQTDRKTGTS